MLILESLSQDSISSIVNIVKQFMNDQVYTFDKTVDSIHFWCSDDKDKTVFFEMGDGYATISKADIENEAESDIIESIIYQLENT